MVVDVQLAITAETLALIACHPLPIRRARTGYFQVRQRTVVSLLHNNRRTWEVTGLAKKFARETRKDAKEEDLNAEAAEYAENYC